MQGHVTPLIITHITRTPQQAVDSMTPALKNAGITTASQVSKLFSEETWAVTSMMFFVQDYHFITLMTLQINRSMLIHYMHSIPQTVAVCPLKGMRNIVKCTSGIMTCPLSCSSHFCVITLLLPSTQCFTESSYSGDQHALTWKHYWHAVDHLMAHCRWLAPFKKSRTETRLSDTSTSLLKPWLEHLSDYFHRQSARSRAFLTHHCLARTQADFFPSSNLAIPVHTHNPHTTQKATHYCSNIECQLPPQAPPDRHMHTRT